METTVDAPQEAGQTHDGPYTSEQVQSLSKLQKLRMDLLSSLVGTGDKPQVPQGTSDKVLLAQLIDGAEKQIHTVTKVKMAQKAQESDDALRGEIAQLLQNYKEPPRREVTDAELQIPAHLKRPEFAPGALDKGVVPVTLSEIALK